MNTYKAQGMMRKDVIELISKSGAEGLKDADLMVMILTRYEISERSVHKWLSLLLAANKIIEHDGHLTWVG